MIEFSRADKYSPPAPIFAYYSSGDYGQSVIIVRHYAVKGTVTEARKRCQAIIKLLKALNNIGNNTLRRGADIILGYIDTYNNCTIEYI